MTVLLLVILYLMVFKPRFWQAGLNPTSNSRYHPPVRRGTFSLNRHTGTAVHWSVW